MRSEGYSLPLTPYRRQVAPPGLVPKQSDFRASAAQSRGYLSPHLPGETLTPAAPGPGRAPSFLARCRPGRRIPSGITLFPD